MEPTVGATVQYTYSDDTWVPWDIEDDEFTGDSVLITRGTVGNIVKLYKDDLWVVAFPYATVLMRSLYFDVIEPLYQLPLKVKRKLVLS